MLFFMFKLLMAGYLWTKFCVCDLMMQVNHISKQIRCFFLPWETTLCNCTDVENKTKPQKLKQMKHKSFFLFNNKRKKNLCFFSDVLFNFSLHPIWLHLKQWIGLKKYESKHKSTHRNTDLFQILPVEPFDLYRKIHDYRLNDDPNRQRFWHDVHRFKQGTTSIPAFQYELMHCSISNEREKERKIQFVDLFCVDVCF